MRVGLLGFLISFQPRQPTRQPSFLFDGPGRIAGVVGQYGGGLSERLQCSFARQEPVRGMADKREKCAKT